VADLVRTGTNLQGVSEPGYGVRPANDFDSVNITMDVDVQAGQAVYLKSNGKGALADASAMPAADVVGLASKAVKAGQRVAVVSKGKMSGFSGGTVGGRVFLSDTTGEVADAAGTVPRVIGRLFPNGMIYVDCRPHTDDLVV
jgi:hypothetical protein